LAAVCNLLALALASPAFADEGQVRLKDAPGKSLVEANCSMCHSLD
jgi:cytochrome c5